MYTKYPTIRDLTLNDTFLSSNGNKNANTKIC